MLETAKEVSFLKLLGRVDGQSVADSAMLWEGDWEQASN